MPLSLLCWALNGPLESVICSAQVCSSPLVEHVLYLSLFTKDQTVVRRQSYSPTSAVSGNLEKGTEGQRLVQGFPVSQPQRNYTAKLSVGQRYLSGEGLCREHLSLKGSSGIGGTCLASFHECGLCPVPYTGSAGRCSGRIRELRVPNPRLEGIVFSHMAVLYFALFCYLIILV